jgi:1,4-dihydroxy-2-naphthoate octaprenyltransferase
MSKKKQASLGGSALAYLIACRPWTFTASVVPMVLTAVLRQASLFSKTFGCALLSGILVHAASNLTNTYFDFVSGRDTKDESGDRSLVDRTVSQQGVLILSAVLYLLSVLAASVVLPSSSQGTLIMVFLAGVLLSFFYTAGPFR